MNVTEFLKKFYRLRDTSPRIFSKSRDNENSLYTDEVSYSKNAYYVFAAGWTEDCYYGEFLVKCKDCVDCLKVEQSELCYECVNCYQVYNGNFLFGCRATRDSEYCVGLQDCNDCFLSSNLHHKSFVFKNRQCASPEEYRELVNTQKTASTKELYYAFMQLFISSAGQNLALINTENCIGSEISNSKNVYWGFDLVNAENFMYADESGYGRDCCDASLTFGELNYDCCYVSKNSYNCSACFDCTSCVNCELCSTGFNLQDCFGCVYLKDKKFHILNEPYEPEAYKREAAALKKALCEAKMYNLGTMVS